MHLLRGEPLLQPQLPVDELDDEFFLQRPHVRLLHLPFQIVIHQLLGEPVNPHRLLSHLLLHLLLLLLPLHQQCRLLLLQHKEHPQGGHSTILAVVLVKPGDIGLPVGSLEQLALLAVPPGLLAGWSTEGKPTGGAGECLRGRGCWKARAGEALSF